MEMGLKTTLRRRNRLSPKCSGSVSDQGPVGERAERMLNRLAGESLPRNADGVNPEALAAMVAALKRLRALSPEAAKQLTFQAALLGQHGLRLQDPERRHHVEGIAEPLTGLEVACLIQAGVQLASPGAETRLPLEREYHRATHDLG